MTTNASVSRNGTLNVWGLIIGVAVGVMFVRHDATALSRTLERVLLDTELRARLTAGCQAVTSRLGWDEPVREMETLYTALASRQVIKAESERME